MKYTYSLNPRQLEWIKALRSGRYRQGVSFLFSDGKRCCLGVACDLIVKRGWASIKTTRIGGKTYFGDHDGGDEVLPEAAAEAMGFISDDGMFYGNFEMKGNLSLAQANDEGVSFADIADYCERHPTHVFTRKSLIRTPARPDKAPLAAYDAKLKRCRKALRK